MINKKFSLTYLHKYKASTFILTSSFVTQWLTPKTGLCRVPLIIKGSLIVKTFKIGWVFSELTILVLCTE